MKILLVLLLIPLTAGAQNCPVSMGGYCLETLWKKTMDSIATSSQEQAMSLQVMAGSITDNSPEIMSETLYYGNYVKFWEGLSQKELVTPVEYREVFDEAAKAGGTKIGGVNLVVLAARTLQKLVDLQVLTLEQAQEILNGAKIVPSP